MGKPGLSALAQLPSIDRLLNSPSSSELILSYGRKEIKHVAQEALESMRIAIKQGGIVDTNEAAICSLIEQKITRDANGQIRRVINLTGTLLHTNLGRAILPQESIDAVLGVLRDACNLEYDLESGERGNRDEFIEKQICRLTGAEAATVVNNNAAAVMLILNTLALGKEVPVSRGELVEIGGSFRIPEIMSQSGCKLIEVGSTNRTHRGDFAKAFNSQTAMIMKVHQSNYVIQGFTASVDDKDLAGLCAESDIPLVIDLGSGTLVNLEDYGLPHEPTPMGALKSGADIVTFSGDKLLGGPQAGIIVGCRELIDKLNANPMKRALRCDKMTIAALSSLLQLYNHPDQLTEKLPVLRMMIRSIDDIRQLVIPLVAMLTGRFAGKANVALVECNSEIGSGALPDRLIPSVGIAIRPLQTRVNVDAIAKAFRSLPIPVIGRIHNGEFLLDCRCLEHSEEFSAQLSELKINE